MSNLTHSGTGRTFIERELPDDHGRFTIEDDGDNDVFVNIRVEDDDGNAKSLSALRREIGDDDQYIDVLERAFGQSDAANNPGGGSPTTFNSPPAFKCDECNRTWPRRQNQTPDQSTDTCPECESG